MFMRVRRRLIGWSFPCRTGSLNMDDTDDSTDTVHMGSTDMPLSDLSRHGALEFCIMQITPPRLPVKPLIDIKSLGGGPPLLAPILWHEDSVKNLNGEVQGTGC